MSSPLGTTQLRQFIMPGGDIRVDLFIPSLGRLVAHIQRSGLSSSTPHSFQFDLHTGSGDSENLPVTVDGWEHLRRCCAAEPVLYLTLGSCQPRGY